MYVFINKGLVGFQNCFDVVLALPGEELNGVFSVNTVLAANTASCELLAEWASFGLWLSNFNTVASCRWIPTFWRNIEG